jgi:hypothetical protein
MRLLGFSTGALALGDFKKALNMLDYHDTRATAIELSALRVTELEPLVSSLDSLDLTRYQYVSIHAPSGFSREEEPKIIETLRKISERKWPIVIHPDAIHDWQRWEEFGAEICIENMDKRKPIGRNFVELADCFVRLPKASLCLDLGHARQVDPTMKEAMNMLRLFGGRLVQIHLSEVDEKSRHKRLSIPLAPEFTKIAHLIPQKTPIILESMIKPSEIVEELERAELAFVTHI